MLINIVIPIASSENVLASSNWKIHKIWLLHYFEGKSKIFNTPHFSSAPNNLSISK